MKKETIRKVNKVLMWLCILGFIGAVCRTTHYVIETYNDNTTYTLNVNPKN
jgi:hypothetical protein